MSMTHINLVDCIQKMFRTFQGCKAVFPIMKNDTPFIEGSSVNRYGVSSPKCIVTFCEVRAQIKSKQCVAVISPKINSLKPVDYDKHINKEYHVIKSFFLKN